MMDLNTATAKEIASYFSDRVNNICFKPDRIAEEQRASEEMKDLDILWIKVLSSPAYRTDLRNDASASAGRKLAGIPFVKRKIKLAENQKMQEVAEKMKCEHRTLQQNFSALVFCHFLQSCNKKESQTLTEVMGDSFYKLPTI